MVLAGLAAGLRNVRVAVVRTETDLGINEACRNALASAAGEFIVLLNNDTIVTEHWLHQLIGLANLSPAVGMVGPMSNYAAPPQLVEVVPYRLGDSGEWIGNREGVGNRGEWIGASRNNSNGANGTTRDRPAAIDTFAKEWREKHKGKWQEAERLGGFCLLMKRQVLTRIGKEINECSDLGLFDTDILSSKAREAGFNLAVCRDLFIHHFGTRTFAHGGGRPDESPRFR